MRVTSVVAKTLTFSPNHQISVIIDGVLKNDILYLKEIKSKIKICTVFTKHCKMNFLSSVILVATASVTQKGMKCQA